MGQFGRGAAEDAESAEGDGIKENGGLVVVWREAAEGDGGDARTAVAAGKAFFQEIERLALISKAGCKFRTRMAAERRKCVPTD